MSGWPRPWNWEWFSTHHPACNRPYRLGRGVNPFRSLADQLRARKRGADVAPIIIFDQRLAYSYVNSLAAGINRPAVEASLRLEGTNIVAQAGQVGRQVDVDATLVFLSAQLQAFRDVEVPLVVTETEPLILDVSAQEEPPARSCLRHCNCPCRMPRRAIPVHGCLIRLSWRAC